MACQCSTSCSSPGQYGSWHPSSATARRQVPNLPEFAHRTHPCNLLCWSDGGRKAGAPPALGLGVAVPPDPHPRRDSGGTRPQPLRHATVCEQPGSRIQPQRGWAGSDGAVGGQDGCGDWRQSTGGGVCGGNQRAAALPSPPRHLAGGGARRPLLPPLPALGTGGPGPEGCAPGCSGFLSLSAWAWECPSRTRTWPVQLGEIGFVLAPVRPPPPHTSILPHFALWVVFSKGGGALGSLLP